MHTPSVVAILVNEHEVLLSKEDVPTIAGATLRVVMAGKRVQRVEAYWPKEKRKAFLHHLVIGRRDGMIVDHANRNPLDNRRENLRHVTGSNSAANRALPTGYSGYRGVHIGKSLGTWEAFITVKGRRKCLGIFKDKHAAALAYNVAAQASFGDAAVLNDVVGAAGVEPATSGV